MDDVQGSWGTQAGTIRKGMAVIDSDGSFLGLVANVQGEEVILDEPDHPFIALTQIDGIEDDRIVLSPRGDATFGLGAQP